MDKLRGTGRTTRMLEAALERAKEGMHVCILGATWSECHRFKKELLLMKKFTPGLEIEVTVPWAIYFDWKDFSAPGMSKYEFFVDHYTIETNSIYQNMILQLHRFDKEKKDA